MRLAGGYLAIRKEARAAAPFMPEALGFARRRYLPGASFLLFRRPRNLTLLLPTFPEVEKLPLTGAYRVQRLPFALLPGGRHLPPRFRPGWARSTLKATFAVIERT